MYYNCYAEGDTEHVENSWVCEYTAPKWGEYTGSIPLRKCLEHNMFHVYQEIVHWNGARIKKVNAKDKTWLIQLSVDIRIHPLTWTFKKHENLLDTLTTSD